MRGCGRIAAAALVAFSVSGWCPGNAQTLTSSGTGFFVNAEGWVLTNAHVVEGCDRVAVSGHDAPRRIVRDDDNDLAAVLTNALPGGAHLAFRLMPPRLAENVHALGYPLSGVLSSSIKVTSGTVNALAGMGDDSRYVQVSSPLQPGNSGGPLIDDHGLVVGVATSTLGERAYARAQNVNFALKTTAAIAFLHANGIAFELAPTQEDARALPDVVEVAAAATVMILCIGESAPAGRTTPDTGVAQPSGFLLEPGFDVLGFDYRMIRDASQQQCESECARDSRCQAFTFNQRHRVCFLKEDAAILLRHDDAVGGYRRALAGTLFRSGFTILANSDSPGGDYARVRDTGFLNCYAECELDPRCKGFAFVRARRDCWLKDRIGPVVRQDGVEFGMR